MLNKSRGKIFRTIARTVLVLADNIDHFYLKQKLEILAFDLISIDKEIDVEDNLEKIKSLIILSGEADYVALDNVREMINFIDEAFTKGRVEDDTINIKEIIKEAKESMSNKGEGDEKKVRKNFNSLNSDNKINMNDSLEIKSSEDLDSSEITSKIISSENSKQEKKSFKLQSKTNERREKILNKLKQDGICFLKDLSILLPDFTERTLRYDLEQLIKEGTVEKIGNSGPGTFYRVK